jgi:flagellar hook capping protein FlgD
MTVRRSAWARAATLGAAAAFLVMAAGPARAAIPPAPGGPILVVTSSADGFGRYLPEILRAEGLNEFDVADVGELSAQRLAGHGVVVLGPTALSGDQTATLTAWVQGGGDLIAMRPPKILAPLLGLADAGGTVSDGSIVAGAGSGVTAESMRFHGSADLYALSGASAIATLDSGHPAVSLRGVGAAGGQAAAFTYDLARSVVYTRQGNPAWAGTERDGHAEAIRSDDMFFGGSQPDWVDLSRVDVPTADEQQRILANLVVGMSDDRMPLPRFWYLPRGLKAAVVLTGDDHNYNLGGTRGQFDRYIADSPSGCSVDDWQCVRSTSYVFPGTSITDAQAAAYQAVGFEIALHLWVSGSPTGEASGDGNCHNFPSSAAVAGDLAKQLALFHSTYPSLAAPTSNRNHCIVYSDWSSVPNVELANGIRLDTNYYYWPDTWVQDRPGFFTGSGFPQRFAETSGALIDVYQAATQLTDESGQTISTQIAALLDKALGPAGYYGVVTANMHTDEPIHAGADAIIAAAQARGVPVVSARQMLTWLDGRNASSFQGLAFDGGRLSFRVAPGAGATGLHAMLPANGPTGALQGIARDGHPVSHATQTIKGIAYATFPAAAGNYVATYPAPPAAAPPTTPAVAKAASKPKLIRTVEVLSRRTKAPTFPALKLSAKTFRPGAGRSLAITFRLKRTSRVVLTLRTRKGKVVRRIRTPRRYKAGTVLRLRWDGRDAKGRYVAPGTYRFTLTATGTRYQRTARGSVRVLAVK